MAQSFIGTALWILSHSDLEEMEQIACKDTLCTEIKRSSNEPGLEDIQPSTSYTDPCFPRPRNAGRCIELQSQVLATPLSPEALDGDPAETYNEKVERLEELKVKLERQRAEGSDVHRRILAKNWKTPFAKPKEERVRVDEEMLDQCTEKLQKAQEKATAKDEVISDMKVQHAKEVTHLHEQISNLVKELASSKKEADKHKKELEDAKAEAAGHAEKLLLAEKQHTLLTETLQGMLDHATGSLASVRAMPVFELPGKVRCADSGR
ncbi:hypothetical protein EIP91_010050 [Steccherinum ochraceum]|uniref:Uncharacterized protein n=1 Tax=Steccherinum ochraceum TaxID=92696 RepID=A0A4R0R374_9APHY|nr:hypothetical protein EIP91_010050 [Steccherinum ochraceum]